MNRDFLDMLCALSDQEAEFLIVGAYALAAHGHPRATGDLDIWVRPSEENAGRVMSALEAFGAPLFDLTEADLRTPGVVFQIGVPPCRIDILTEISALGFDEAWKRRYSFDLEGLNLACLSKADFSTNKRAVGRPKDLADVAIIEGLEPTGSGPDTS